MLPVIVQSVGKLVSGAVGGKLFLLAITPVLTRLYEPQEFSDLAVFVGFLATIGCISCLRYEVAIPLVKCEREASALLVLALGLSVGSMLFTGFVLIAFSTSEQLKGFYPTLWSNLYILPFSVLMFGLFLAAQMWATRKRAFSVMATTKVVQAVAGGLFMVVGGVGGIGVLGLIVGHSIAVGAGGIGLLMRTAYPDLKLIGANTNRSILKAAKRYVNYPKYSCAEALFNVGGLHVPVMIMAALKPADAAAWFLAAQVIGAPVLIVSGALAQVVSSRISGWIELGQIDKRISQLMFVMGVLGSVPILIVAMLSPHIFTVVFGEKWRGAGELVPWLAPWFISQLVASPVSIVLHALDRINLATGLQLFGFSMRVATVILVALTASDIVVESLAIANAAFYILYAAVVIGVAKKVF